MTNKYHLYIISDEEQKDLQEGLLDTYKYPLDVYERYVDQLEPVKLEHFDIVKELLEEQGYKVSKNE